MKVYVLAIFILLAGGLFARAYYRLQSLEYETSAISNALGGGTGVVYIWSDSPILNNDNPALPALQDGLSYGVSTQTLKDGYTLADGWLYLSHGGLAFLLPAPNLNIGTGRLLDMHIRATGYAEDYRETAPHWGLAANPFPLLRHYHPGKPWISHLDAAVGFTTLPLSISEKSIGCEDPAWNEYHQSTDVTAVGFVIRHSWQPSLNKNYEVVVGADFTNVNKARIESFDFGDTAPVVRHTRAGAAFSLSLPAKAYKPILDNKLPLANDNLLTARALVSALHISSVDLSPSVGAELGILDTIFLRTGLIDDEFKHIHGLTYGYGINLHYKDLVTASFNHAFTPDFRYNTEGTIQSFDGNVSFHLLNIYQRMKK